MLWMAEGKRQDSDSCGEAPAQGKQLQPGLEDDIREPGGWERKSHLAAGRARIQ